MSTKSDDEVDIAEAMLAAGDLVISSRGSCVVVAWGGGGSVCDGSNETRKCGGDGDVEEQV